MEYLLAAIKSSRRKLSLQQWLLLAVRTLLVLLMVLAVAEPFLAGSPLAFVPGERTHRVLVVDGSYSMGYKPADTSRFDLAKQLAAQIVQASPQGDGFTLVLMTSPAVAVVGTPVFEPGDFLGQIEDLALTHTTADLGSTLAKVQQVLDRARREQPGLKRREVYFLTDLGRVGWAPEAYDSAAAEELRRRARQLAKLAAVTVLDVGQPDAENTAVTHVYTAAPFVTVAETIEIEAQIKSFGRKERTRLPVELVVDGRRVKQQPVDLAAGGQASVVFTYRFESAGDHAVEVRLAGDRLDVDDRRYLAVPVKQAIQVLCVDGRPSGRPFKGATDFLTFALAPRAHMGQVDNIRPHVVPESALLELDLARYDCVFLADVAQFTSSEGRVLDTYVQNGGSLVFFLGSQVLADRYNRELAGERSGGVDLLPARLGPIVDAPQFRLDPLDYRHPIVRAFRDRELSGLLTTPVRKYFKLLLREDVPSEVALATESGDPLIVERPVGRGRVILVATSGDISWTPMPVWPSYVPIVQELLAFAVAGELAERNVLVGQALGGLLPHSGAGASLEVQLPDGRIEPLGLRAAEGTAAWTYAQTTTSGLYTVRSGPPADQSQTYAVNVDTVESDLARLTPEELREEVWTGVPFEYQTSWQGPIEPSAVVTTERSGLAKTLLYAVLALLFTETFLARRFGYHGP